jgi:predicted PurR-regulated permease PerM
VQLVLLPLAVVGAYVILRAAGAVILLFIIGGLIALLLNPFVTLLRRLGLPRGVAVLVVMLVLIAAVAGIGLLVANPISDQVSAFQHSVPGIVDDANRTLAQFQDWLDRNGINVQVAKEGQTALQTLGENVSTGSGHLVSFTRDAIQTLVEASLALILIIVISVYMLLYGERIGSAVRTVMPRGVGTPEDDFPTRIQSAVFGYVRGQLLFSLIMGTSAGVLLWVLGTLGIFPQGRTYALFFGAWYGFAELIPYIGPAIGGFPPVIIAAFSAEPLDAVWLIIAFTGLQQLEGHVVAPNVFGQALRINPLLVIFALLLGGQIYGFIGAFIALPLAAIIRETIVYFRRHLVFERWDLPAVSRGSPGGEGEPTVSRETQPLPASLPGESGEAAAAGEAGKSGEPGPAGGDVATRRCPECGEAVARDASTCSACGTELGKPDGEAAATSAAPG